MDDDRCRKSAFTKAMLICSALVGGCSDDVSVTGDETSSGSSGAPSSCATPEPRTELIVVACEDAECRFPTEDPWGPQSDEAAGEWSTTCTVAGTQLGRDDAIEVTLDSCTPVVGGWTPATIRVALDASLGHAIGLVAGQSLEVSYRSSRDDLSWIWRGWFLRDTDGKLVIARAKGRPPPAAAFDVDELSVSLQDCPAVTDYCGSTLRYGALWLSVDGEEVTVPNTQHATLRRADGVWDVAVASARSYEGAACGVYSDYVHVDFAIAAVAER